MDPVTLVVVPGFLGGVLVALVALHLQRRSISRVDPFEQQPRTDVINAARIRVAGIGGLGLVAMAAVVAIAQPRIGIPVAISVVFGAGLAALLIAVRRRTGGMPSSGERMGANTTLSIEAPAPLEGADDSTRDAQARAVTPAST
jgi:Na+/H+ antiporter NhaD/arsenite permease-like protein